MDTTQASPTPSIWQRPGNAGASNDLDDFVAELSALAHLRGFKAEVIGHALGHGITLLQRQGDAPAAPQLLIATGFHGEEPAGPWGLIEFLRLVPDEVLDAAHLSLLPLVNATGFAAGLRLNAQGQNPNRGFGRGRGDDTPSLEGQVLMAHATRLFDASRDGALSCHEDRTRHDAYAYTFEPGTTAGHFSRTLTRTASRWFALPPDGDIEGRPVKDGVIHNHYDGSFEAWLSEHGATVAACIETPGMEPFAPRMEAQAALMLAFICQRTSH